MNAIFGWPIAFAAAAAIPVLVGIYLLRNRFRKRTVSSLMFWEERDKSHKGGLQINRIQTPLLFILELLTIILLVLAAAGPMIRSSRDRRVLVVVLDDSFSMLAEDGSTSRDRAVEGIKTLLAESGDFSVRFILASKVPQVLGDSVSTLAQAQMILDRWQCLSPGADIFRAVALAAEVGGKTARILVVSDHQPESMANKGRVEWWGFGKASDNMAFVNASRKAADGKDRCFLAIANLADKSASRKLLIESLETGRTVMEESVELLPGQVRRVVFEVKKETGGLIAKLDDDRLRIDNQVLLLGQSDTKLKVKVDIEDEVVRSLVEKAVGVSNNARITSSEPQMVISDAKESAAGLGSETWTVKLISDPNAVAYVGPFVVDKSHRLTEGLSLSGVIWGAGKSALSGARPLVAAGNIPLVTVRERINNRNDVTIYLNRELSTLHQSPNWPILFWNLIEWRRDELAGLDETNIVLGSTAKLRMMLTDKGLVVTDPAGEVKEMPMAVGNVVIEATLPGLYELKTAHSEYRFAVNAMSKGQSDLRKAVSGKWGQWQQVELFWWEYRAVDWLLLLLGLVFLTAHRYVTSRGQKGGSR